jgi:ABC-2 type transport system permease protein
MLPPLDGAPGWLQVASDLNPLTYIVEAERALFSGSYPADTVLAGFLAAAIVAVLGVTVGVRSMQRSS